MNTLRFVSAMLLALAVCASVLAGEPAVKGGGEQASKKRILLKSIDAKYVSEGEAQSLETLVCGALSANKSFDVACPADINALMKEQSLRMAMGSCNGVECGNTDKILKCDMTALAVVQAADERYVLTLTLNAPESGEELAKAWVGTAANGKALADQIPGVVKELYANLSKPRPPQTVPAKAAAEKKPAPEKSAAPTGQEKK